MPHAERRYLPITDRRGIRLEKRMDGDTELIPAIEGVGAVFYDAKDPAGTQYRLFSDTFERIMPGAFDRAIREDDVRGLANHDVRQLLGRTSAGTMTLTVDAAGLAYSIDTADNSAGRDTVVSIQRGDMDGSSFSFVADTTTWLEETDADGRTTYYRQIESVQLFDVGPVTFPAYSGTTAGTRSPSAFLRADSFEALLESRDAEAAALVAEFREQILEPANRHADRDRLLRLLDLRAA